MPNVTREEFLIHAASGPSTARKSSAGFRATSSQANCGASSGCTNLISQTEQASPAEPLPYKQGIASHRLAAAGLLAMKDLPLVGISRPQGVRPRGLPILSSPATGAAGTGLIGAGSRAGGAHLLMKPGPCENAAERAKALVESLGSDDWDERAQARAELIDLLLLCPDEAEPEIKNGAKDTEPDLERRTAARRILRDAPWRRFRKFLNSLVAGKRGRGQLAAITTREVLTAPCKYWEEMKKVENPSLAGADDAAPGSVTLEDWFAALHDLDDICNREFSAAVTREKAARAASLLTRLRREMEE